MSLQRYVLVNADGTERDYEFSSFNDARKAAKRQNCAVVMRIYVLEGTELVWTPDGDYVWTPT